MKRARKKKSFSQELLFLLRKDRNGGCPALSLCCLASECQQMRGLPTQAAPAQKGRVSRKSLSMMDGGGTKSSSFR